MRFAPLKDNNNFTVYPWFELFLKHAAPVITERTVQLLRQTHKINASKIINFLKKLECSLGGYVGLMRLSHLRMSIITHRPCEAELEAHWVGEAVRVGLWYLEGI